MPAPSLLLMRECAAYQNHASCQPSTLCLRSCAGEMAAAGRLQVRPGDIAARLRAEKQCGVRDLLGLPGSAHWANAALDFLPLCRIGATPAVSLGRDQPRREIVHCDTKRRVLPRKVNCQVVLRAFKCRVDGEFCLRGGLVDAADCEHATPALRLHRRKDFL